jgi:hypothetical protein
MDRTNDFAYDAIVPPDVIALMGRGMMRRGPVSKVGRASSFIWQCFSNIGTSGASTSLQPAFS